MVSSISKTDNQPKQAPKKEEINYDDKRTWTYPLNDKQISIIQDGFIEMDYYKTLPDDKKKMYIPKPITAPNSLANIIKLLSDFGILATLSAPVFDVMKNFPQPNPFDKIVVIFKTIDKLMEIVTAIETLEDIPIIGTLASPVVRALRLIIEFFMAIFYAVIMLLDGTMMIIFKLEKDLPKIKERWAIMWENGETPDRLSKEIKQLEDEARDGNWDVFTSTKEWKQFLNELNSLVKPINEIYNLVINMTEKFSIIVDMFKYLDWRGEKFTLDNVSKFVLGKSWREMEEEAQERVEKEFNKGPLPKLFDIIEKMDKLSEQQYILKEDYIRLLNHKKALKKIKAEEDEKEGMFYMFPSGDEIANEFTSALNYNTPKSTISK